MSFYGNITASNQNQFTFDKTYSNRYAMEQSISTDGVYIGRYVLVEYNSDNSSNLVSGVFRGASSQDPENQVYYLYSSSRPAIENRLQYTEKKSESDPLKGEGEGILEGQNVIVYDKQIATFYQCIGYNTENNKNYAKFKKILEGSTSSEAYIQNYTIDLNHYSNVGRSGYDSTVWQKVLHNDTEKYIMIAELNSVVPSFDIQVDGPTESPLPPHFDIASTSVNYKLHVQPSWGFRIKAATDASKSDELVSHKKWQYAYNPSTNSDSINSVPTATNIKGDIYYNAAGFNKDVRTYAEDAENYISITPGKSGSTYYDHKAKKVQEMDDVQELSIHLPVIGNTICTLWDIIHGENRDDGEGSLMYIISQAPNTSETNNLESRIANLEKKVTTWDAAEANVQSDWSVTDTTSDSYIQNKPTGLITSEDLNVVELQKTIKDLQDRIAALEGTATV